MNCEPSFHPNFQPGDKIFPTNSALAKTEEGVHSQEMRKVMAL